MKIWKFPITSNSEEIMMPRGARTLCVQLQGEVPHVWALVDPTAPLKARTIKAVATGSDCDCDCPQARYLGTVQMRWGTLVFHFFDMGE